MPAYEGQTDARGGTPDQHTGQLVGGNLCGLMPEPDTIHLTGAYCLRGPSEVRSRCRGVSRLSRLPCGPSLRARVTSRYSMASGLSRVTLSFEGGTVTTSGETKPATSMDWGGSEVVWSSGVRRAAISGVESKPGLAGALGSSGFQGVCLECPYG